MQIADSFLTESPGIAAVEKPGDTAWQAELVLRFARTDGLANTSLSPDAQARTALIERRHRGPLRVQKTLYPEGDAICHAIILHPPAGIAGGDALTIDIEVGAGAHAVLTTPGAAKWYKSSGRIATQTIQLQLHEGAHIDWLPQENIFFDACHADTQLNIDCAAGASAIGWDAYVLGRQAAGEHWRAGYWRNRTQLYCNGRLRWIEAFELAADSPLRISPVGMAGLSVMANLWAIGPAVNETLAEALAEQLPWANELRAGVTCLREHDEASGILLLRVLGKNMEAVQGLLRSLWLVLRPALHDVDAKALRIWAT